MVSWKLQMSKLEVRMKKVRKPVRSRWTKEEVKVLRSMYRTQSNAEIAARLGRKVTSVVFKGHRLGLSKGAQRLKEMGKENIGKRWKKRGRK
jgi:hypothetical protein